MDHQIWQISFDHRSSLLFTHNVTQVSAHQSSRMGQKERRPRIILTSTEHSDLPSLALVVGWFQRLDERFGYLKQFPLAFSFKHRN